MSSPIKSIEELFLKIFKATVLSIMGLALVAVLLLIASSAYQYSQSPKEPAPAKKAPTQEIIMGDVKTFLIEQEKQKKQAEVGGSLPKQKPAEKHTSLLFSEEAVALYRCSVDFGKAVGASVEETDNQINSQKVESLRAEIEKIARDPFRGKPWVKSSVDFTCKTLADTSIITMKKEGKIGAVFLPTLGFHLLTWDKIQAEKLEFEQNEEKRVASERVDEQLRVSAAKASAFSLLIGAASAFALFMMLALYLLGARIENNLRNINESIQGKEQPLV